MTGRRRPASLSGPPLRPPPHALSTVIPAKAGIQVRPPTKNAEPRGSDGDGRHDGSRVRSPSIPVDANLDPRLRGDDGGEGVAHLAGPVPDMGDDGGEGGANLTEGYPM